MHANFIHDEIKLIIYMQTVIYKIKHTQLYANTKHGDYNIE